MRRAAVLVLAALAAAACTPQGSSSPEAPIPARKTATWERIDDGADGPRLWRTRAPGGTLYASAHGYSGGLVFVSDAAIPTAEAPK